MIVYLVSIEHDHGINHSLHRTEDEARAEVYEFVECWWENELSLPSAMPGDRDEAIEAYFEGVERESYEVERLVLDDA
jgi:hypothetical protein